MLKNCDYCEWKFCSNNRNDCSNGIKPTDTRSLDVCKFLLRYTTPQYCTVQSNIAQLIVISRHKDCLCRCWLFAIFLHSILRLLLLPFRFVLNYCSLPPKYLWHFNANNSNTKTILFKYLLHTYAPCKNGIWICVASTNNASEKGERVRVRMRNANKSTIWWEICTV